MREGLDGGVPLSMSKSGEGASGVLAFGRNVSQPSICNAHNAHPRSRHLRDKESLVELAASLNVMKFT